MSNIKMPVTGSGAAILKSSGNGPFITHVTPGKIVDAGIKDANNMGSAMAPSAYETLKAHFEDTGRTPDYYDLIVTGDLGVLGHDTLEDLFLCRGRALTAVLKREAVLPLGRAKVRACKGTDCGGKTAVNGHGTER